MRQFSVAAKRAAQKEAWIEFEIEELDEKGEVSRTVPCKAIAQPTEGQIAFLMSRNGRHITSNDKVVAMLNFFDSALDDETQSYISGRMLDPRDEFGLEEVQEILSGLMEEWTGRPMKRSSVSTHSEQTDGRTLRPDTQESTSSGYLPIGS